jgi:positive regulator of sigma E activity
VAILAGFVGALVGFAIGVVFTEIIFANNADWPIAVPFALAVSGWLAARELVRRRHDRNAEHGVPSASS